MKNKRLTFIILAVAFVLLIPLITMQFTDEVDWSLIDFAVAGVLLMCAGLIIELVIRKIKNINLRIALIITILFVILLIWAELGVGIFNTPLSGS